MRTKANGEIKIDKGIPIPQGRNYAKYPWAEMKIGDSFLAPALSRTGLYTCGARYGFKVRIKNEGVGMVRVWRVS